MCPMKRIHIFKPGSHTDVYSGQSIAFGEDACEASIAAYDPAKHEAPIVIGHPKMDAPAYGYVKSLAAAPEGGIDAEPHQVDAAFAEFVREGRYKKVSAAFYAPDSKHNPVPGVWYLRHVGFLGAHPPSVKGLRQVAFAEDEEGVVAFGESSWAFGVVARLFRRMRERTIADRGVEAADEEFPEWELQTLNEAANPPEPPRGPAFSEPPTQDPDMDPKELAAREAAIAAREQKLQADEAAFAERAEAVASQAAEQARAETVAFVEGLVKEGRVLPRDRDGLVAVLTAQSIGDAVAFGEGEDKFEGVAGDWFKTWLKGLPEQVHFGEFAGHDKDLKNPRKKGFAAPKGFDVDPHRQALHERAVAFMEAHPDTDYHEAIAAVESAG